MMSIKISDLPAYNGDNIEQTSLVGTVIEEGASVTYRVSTQTILAGIADLASDITGDFMGAADTFAALPVAGVTNGDFAVLRLADGGNPAGAYVWDGTDYIYTWPITTFAELPQTTTTTDGESIYPIMYLDANGLLYAFVDTDGNFHDLRSDAAIVDIATNTADIATNTADIAALDVRVTDIEDSGGGSAENGFPEGVIASSEERPTIFEFTDANDLQIAYIGETDSRIAGLAQEPFTVIPRVGKPQLGQVNMGIFQTQSTGVGFLKETDVLFDKQGLGHLMLAGGVYDPEGLEISPNNVVPLIELKKTGRDTLNENGDPVFTEGGTPTSQFYTDTPCTSTAQRLSELSGVQYNSTVVTRSVVSGETRINVTVGSVVQLLHGTPRVVSIQNSNVAGVNGVYPIVVTGGNTFYFVVDASVTTAPTSTLRVITINDARKYIMASTGEGGERIERFKKDQTFYLRAMGRAFEMGRLLSGKGFTNVPCNFFCWMQGESDNEAPDPSNASLPKSVGAYKAEFTQLAADMLVDIRKTTKQQFNPWFLTYQTAGHLFYTSTRNALGFMNIAQALFESARDVANIHMVAPMYILEHNDQVHPNAESINIFSWYVARALKELEATGSRKFLHPTAYSVSGNDINITFEVPQGGLVIDGELIPTSATFNNGFDIWNSANSTVQDIITNVTVLNPTTVRVTTSRPVVAGEYISYARGRKGTTPEHAGYRISTDTWGAVGNLHDQSTLDLYQYITPLTATANRTAKTEIFLRNYCVMFQHQF
jgi:hypothetical protein